MNPSSPLEVANGGCTRGAAAVRSTGRIALLFLFAISGCDHSYVVDRASLQLIRDAHAPRAPRCVIPATRADGTPVLLRADAVVPSRHPAVDDTHVRATARRGRPKFVAGIVMSVFGLGLGAMGADTFISPNRGNPPAAAIIGLPLLTLGGGHLIAGAVLTAVGATNRPEALQSDYPLCTAISEDSLD